MTRQHDDLAIRQEIFADHGGETRFWLGWVYGEIDGHVQDWLRRQALHDPELRQDLESLDAPSARDEVQLALEATNYLTPAAGQSAARPLTELTSPETNELTNLVLQDRPPAEEAHRLTRAAAFACAFTVTRPTSSTPDAAAQARRVLRQALAQLTDAERTLLFSQWQAPDRRKDALLRLLLPEQDLAPPPGGHALPVAQAEAKLRRALEGRRALLRSLGPERLWQYLCEEYLVRAAGAGAAFDAESEGAVRYRACAVLGLLPLPDMISPRAGWWPGAYQRIGHSLFQLLREVEIPLPARDEAAEATRLLRHLAGAEAVGHFYRLYHWLHQARKRMDLAGDLSLYTALDRLLLWLAPECFVTAGGRSLYGLSFRLYLRARLKDYCRQKGWRPAGPSYASLEAAFRALDRERLGEVVREAVQEVARAEDEAAGVTPRQVLHLLQAAP